MQKHNFLMYIGSEHSLDYWSDVALEHAIELANDLADFDWNSICDGWSELGAASQARIAEIASETENWSNSTLKMLVDMLKSEHAEVVEASVDSLNSIAQSDIEKLAGLDFESVVNSVEPTDSVVAAVLNSLKTRLANN